MGLDIYTSLVVGVPLLKLGQIEKEAEEHKLTNRLGELTGRTVTVQNIWFRAGGRRIKIGSNRRNIQSNSVFGDRIEYDYMALLDNSEWIHMSDVAGGPDQVIIGIEISDISGPQIGEHDSFVGATLDDVMTKCAEVESILYDRFKYDGEINVFAQICYSY